MIQLFAFLKFYIIGKRDKFCIRDDARVCVCARSRVFFNIQKKIRSKREGSLTFYTKGSNRKRNSITCGTPLGVLKC